MSKNILIFSDGTGQRGGVNFDEDRTNIYKLYRATRCGPDSIINPKEQITFYDPGIGTVPEGLGTIQSILRWIYNLLSQATGLGLTANITDCYAALIRLYEPGDRIFLFGFSRGAYTVRCLGEVISLCGVPTTSKGGAPLKRDAESSHGIAKEAVKRVYQHVSSPKDEKYLDQRIALAKQFRQNYGSENAGKANVYPYFIGVFDTVAAVRNHPWLVALLALVILASVSLGPMYFHIPFWLTFSVLIGIAVSVTLILNIKVAFSLPGYSWWKTLHLSALKLKFYDYELNPNVSYARHAISIDEHRADFDRVSWGSPKDHKVQVSGAPWWFEQKWFAGNHADIGGGYPENESRLSDISLKWILTAAIAVPDGIKINEVLLQLYPSPDGMQHDETKTGFFSLSPKINRKIISGATLHQSVEERMKLPGVLQFDKVTPYRPENLREHQNLEKYYANSLQGSKT